MSKRRQKRCMSCRRLKIACSQERPSCEYCRSTGRECEYVDTPSPPPQESSDLQLISCPFGTPTAHLQVSNFEFRLLEYFRDFGLKDSGYTDIQNLTPTETLWRNEVPKLWASETVRKSIYLVSSTYLWNGCRLNPLMIENSGGDLATAREMMRCRMVKYFQGSIGELSTAIQRSQDMIEFDPSVAAEIIISSTLLFAFLLVQPFGFIKMLSFEPNTTDFIRFCKSLRVPYLKAMVPLVETGFFPLYFHASFVQNNNLETKHPVLQHMVEKYRELDRSSYTFDDLHAIEDALGELIDAIHLVYKKKDHSKYGSWLLIIQEPFYDLLHSRDPFCMKLLYYYSAMAAQSQFRLSFRTSCLLEYVLEFKEYSVTINQWDSFDEKFHQQFLSHIKKEANMVESYGIYL